MDTFVNFLLLIRDRTPLDECEITYRDPCSKEEYTEVFWFFGIWIHYAVSVCRAKVLKVNICNVGILLRDAALVTSCNKVSWRLTSNIHPLSYIQRTTLVWILNSKVKTIQKKLKKFQ
jgi:hypothetical protein